MFLQFDIGPSSLRLIPGSIRYKSVLVLHSSLVYLIIQRDSISAVLC